MADSTPKRGAGARALWAAQRAAEVAREQGIPEVLNRGRNYLDRRRRPAEPRPTFPPVPAAGARHWPDALVMLAAPDIPQCFRYRVMQKQEMAAAMGLPFLIADLRDAVAARSTIQLGAVLIVYRQAWSQGLHDLVAEARRLGQPVVFEVDDLVYRRELVAANPNMASIPEGLRSAVINGSDAYLNALRSADHVIASTEPLAEDMAKEVAGRAFVIENGIDSDIVAMLRGIAVDPPVQRWLQAHRDEVVITYGSGSRAHDLDLALAADGLRAVLERHRNVRLKLIGPLRLPTALDHLHDQVIRVEAVPLGDYLRELAMSHITIAPLDPAPFNEFKSQVKYVEAGVLRLPLVASPTVYGRYVRDGETALLAHSSGEWAAHLEALVVDPELRARIGSSAFDHVQQWRLDARPGAQFADFVATVMALRGAGA